MWIAEAMVRWLAPILSFTAEEIWRFLPGAREQSVLHSTWAKVPEVAQSDIDWPALISLRADVTRQLEGLREQGVIGAPLDAEVDIYCDAALSPSFAALGEELRFLFITSAARVHTASSPPPGAVAADTAPDGIWMIVQPSKSTKCVRCWHHRPDVGSNAQHPELCSRCVDQYRRTR